jgi:hypothetical protein
VGEAALDHLAALAHRPSANGGLQAGPVGVDSLLRCLIAVSAQNTVGRFWFRDTALPHIAVKLHEDAA